MIVCLLEHFDSVTFDEFLSNNTHYGDGSESAFLSTAFI